VFDAGLNCTISNDLTDGAKRLRNLRLSFCRPRGIYFHRILQDVRNQDPLVKIQVEEDVQLDQDSDPDSQEAGP
jgi:hypothetical protein